MSTKTNKLKAKIALLEQKLAARDALIELTLTNFTKDFEALQNQLFMQKKLYEEEIADMRFNAVKYDFQGPTELPLFYNKMKEGKIRVFSGAIKLDEPLLFAFKNSSEDEIIQHSKRRIIENMAQSIVDSSEITWFVSRSHKIITLRCQALVATLDPPEKE